MPSDPKERREYFRIEDQAYVVVEKISSEQTLKILLKEHSSFLIGSSISALDLEHKPVFTKIKRMSPEIAIYLEAINKKIDLITNHLIETSTEFNNQNKLDIDLSASGIALKNINGFKKDDLVLIKLFLLPEKSGLICTGKVIRVDKSNNKYDLCIDFKEILESDREIIIKHTITKQLSQAREKNH